MNCIVLTTLYEDFGFNCTMGIIDSITVRRAAQEGWSKDGLPTEVDVTISIHDLYQNMSLSRDGDYSTYNNIEYMDMLSTWCGVNMNVPEITRKFRLYEMITKHKFGNLGSNLVEELNQNVADKIKSFITGR